MAWTRFTKKKDMPGGLWIKCENCGTMLFRKEFEARDRVCGSCSYHFTLPGRDRVRLTVDEGSFVEFGQNLVAEDRLKFNDKMPYGEKLKKTREKTGETDAAICGDAAILGQPCVIAVMNFAFLGGSMGMVVGEKIAMAIARARERKVPVVIFACSGGARMHEGAISLMQMAKTCAELSKLNDEGGFSISVMTHPTTGGVTASFASVCDLLIGEPGALIGFAGPRVIATTIKKELPKGFQRSEFLLEKGQIDRIVKRDEMRAELAKMICYATGAEFVAQPAPADTEEESEAAPETSTKASASAKKKPAKPAAKPKRTSRRASKKSKTATSDDTPRS